MKRNFCHGKKKYWNYLGYSAYATSRKLETLLSFNLDGTPDKAYKLPVHVFTFNKQDLIWPELYT